jgi:hypothetical protein
MSPDDIDNLTLNLHNFLVQQFNFPLDDEQDYVDLCEFLHDHLEKFCTRERNYN